MANYTSSPSSLEEVGELVAPTVAALMESIEKLGKDLAEIKATLDKHVADQVEFVISHEVRLNKLDTRVETVETDTRELEYDQKELTKQIRVNEKQIAALTFQARIVSWVAGVLGVSVIALIWSLITGHAALVF